jgi:Tfp pilus assembly protein PilF
LQQTIFGIRLGTIASRLRIEKAKKNILTHGKKQQALALMQQGKPMEARPLLEQVCRTDRSDVEAQFMLGIANGMLGEHAKAE